MHFVKVALLMALLVVVTDASLLRWLPARPPSVGIQRAWPFRRPQQRRQSLVSNWRPQRTAQSTTGDIPHDRKFFRYLCRTTDVCPYSWQWVEGNMLRAIVRLSLQK
ncbi:uncharacterized protein LOC119598256 [Penaeus monodon]|uniref:uncharacterized protein LOC119598256 n=1 Tax=Penaeus monodon TaxID=6687 RepID=UPI0018A78335|nr:uncharacterized protein LOC119598256 [Penaeus monodon]XP_037803834.1 uncharacterized protein LOC119598256 [Penaeus monodon]